MRKTHQFHFIERLRPIKGGRLIVYSQNFKAKFKKLKKLQRFEQGAAPLGRDGTTADRIDSVKAHVFGGPSYIIPFLKFLGAELQIAAIAKKFAENSDQKRMTRQDRRSLLETKEARAARREAMLEENLFYEESEGLLYGPGIAD
ncbi:hypothetical protein ABEB36_007097 [Hypothenemus hampei]|uniref:Uncharacterized protein n=1 Tax=Hypothenemus hampei TaxID=57062 RepID=A0ABD1ESR2_HYPHA